jgi:hypothetical protein
MKMKKNLIRTLFATALLAASAASHAGTLSELELSPRDTQLLSLRETEEALRAAEAAPGQSHIALYNEVWNAADSPTADYVRPDRREWSLCPGCEFHLGVGGTYHSFQGTGGLVIPATVTWDQGRWEFGVFRFGTQTSDDNDENVERLVARPYWGASLSRRFQFFERGPLRAIFGFGVSYRTEQDILSSTYWNFSSQLGLRYQSPNFPAIFELSARHWSNGGVRTPNRGQDFTILTVRFNR